MRVFKDVLSLSTSVDNYINRYSLCLSFSRYCVFFSLYACIFAVNYLSLSSCYLFFSSACDYLPSAATDCSATSDVGGGIPAVEVYDSFTATFVGEFDSIVYGPIDFFLSIFLAELKLASEFVSLSK